MEEKLNALNKLCNQCRLSAINEGYMGGCAWLDIDNEHCIFYEFIKKRINESEELEKLITSHNVR